MENSNRLRIVLLDSQYFFRTGLRTVLSREPDLQVAGEVSTLEECFALVRSESPDVVLLEAALANEETRGALRALRPSLALLFLADESSVASLTASGEMCVLRNDASTQAVATIRRIAGRMPIVNTSSAESDLRALARSTSHFSIVPGLTARESEVVKILSEGRTARQVANELGLSIKTVEAHKLNVMRKFGVHNRTQLIRHTARQSVGGI
ncbi:MAG TPA: response regulator transcription factor [Bryobacteraceae bacterium]|nr:response regulator transcription factor [Bryobacteraceae bacterium]